MKSNKFFKVEDASRAWKLSERSVRNYCAEGRVDGAVLDGKTWLIPYNAKKPGRIMPKKVNYKENLYCGIDLGTSGVKLLLVNTEGKIIDETTEKYPINIFNGNWSEQNPKDWWEATLKGFKTITAKINKDQIKGISFGGQMHGLVALNKDNEVIRPAILWNDGRTFAEVEYLNNKIGKAKLVKYTGNFAFAGFTAPKILWLRNHEYRSYKDINMILLPKDYLSFMFSGVFATDYSDASGTLLLDVKNKTWSKEMCKICGVKLNQLPKLYESYEVIGNIREDIAKKLGLSKDVKIIAGAGDNAAAAIGTGCVNENSCNISLGTSGTIFISTSKFVSDSKLPIHSFDHANGKYHLMGCILNAASANGWFVKNILKSSFMEEFSGIDSLIGNNSVYFLPYLTGERCPHNDVNAKGAFVGLTPNTSRQAMCLSVVEGVTFALKDCLEIAREKGINIATATVCGGGTKTNGWLKILANVLDLNLSLVETEQGPGYGAAILAMVGCKEYKDVEEACDKIVKVKKIIFSDPSLVQKYKPKYETFKNLYISLKDNFVNWN